MPLLTTDQWDNTPEDSRLVYSGQAAEGIDPQAPKETLKAAGTVKSLAEAYIGRHAKLKKNTWIEDESYLARHLLPRFGTRLAQWDAKSRTFLPCLSSALCRSFV